MCLDCFRKPRLSTRFQDALVYATQLHNNQTRKGTHVPYVAHLLGVAALVLEDGGDEDEAIGALLHDAVEDQGGRKTLKVIRERFGEHVAMIVEGCTDAFTIPKPPWRQRKEKYIEHIRHAPPEVRRVSLADKLYNARSILESYREFGEKTWERFNGGKEGSLWYYFTLLKTFQETGREKMVGELERVLNELLQLAS